MGRSSDQLARIPTSQIKKEFERIAGSTGRGFVGIATDGEVHSIGSMGGDKHYLGFDRISL